MIHNINRFITLLLASLGFFSMAIVQLSGQSALTELVSRDYEDEKLSYILFNLSERHVIDIRYNKSLLPEGRYTYSFKETPMSDVLKIVLNDKALHYKEYATDKIIIVPAEWVDVDSTLTINLSIESDESRDSILIGEFPGDNTFPFKIIGSIIDDRAFFPVASALIVNQSTGDYTTSSKAGEFTLNLEAGDYLLQVTSIGHDSRSFNVHVQNDDIWEIALEPKAHLIEEIVISAASDQQKADQTIIGLEEISRNEIKKLSVFMGEPDVVKSVLALAGVSTVGEGSSGFNVRGGSIDQNLILQDGAIIFNPSHVLGFFSTFNPDIIRNTTLSKGHLPAYYGSRISSVLDITTKDPNSTVPLVKAAVGLISSKISLETPIIGSKTGAILSARKSYSGWMLNEVDNADIQSSAADFYDINAKISHAFSERTKLNLSFFQSFDKFNFADDFGYSWRNQLGNLTFRHIQSDKLSFAAMIAKGNIKNNQFQPNGPLAFNLSSGIEYLQSGMSTLWTPSNHEFKMGLDILDYNLDPEVLAPINGSASLNESVNKEKALELALYVNDQWDITDNLSIDIGVRFSFYRQRGPSLVSQYETQGIYTLGTTSYQELLSGTLSSYSGMEPRLAIRYKLTDQLSARASANRINQYVQLLSNTATPTPVDIWQLSTRYIAPLIGTDYGIGLSQSSQGVDYSIDVYYKKMEGIIDYRDFADLLLQNQIETQLVSGNGRSYGAEISLNKREGKITGRISYAYSKSERQISEGQATTINRGEWYPSAYDQPHNVKLFFNWQMSKGSRLNINFVYNTGRPITAPIGNYTVQGVVISNFSDRNAFRVPDYHRMDIGLTTTLNRRKSARYKSELTFSLYNFYARKNTFSVFFRQEQGSLVNALRLSVIGTVIPSVSYSFQF